MIRSPRQFILLLVGLSALWSLSSHDVLHGRTRAIVWDGYGYYLYLPAVLTYGDVTRFDFVRDHLATYSPSDQPYQIFETDGIRTPNYTMGLAILWLPFYLLATLWAGLDPRFPADGLSQPYQWMVVLAALAWLWIGLTSLDRFLEKRLERRTVLVVLATLTLGTNLWYYATNEPAMPHVYLFALYSLLLVWADRFTLRPGPWLGAGLGAVLALMALSRPSEGIAGGLILFFFLRSHGWRGFLQHVREFRISYAAMVFTGALMLLPQLLIWKWTTGHWVYNTYAAYGHSFDFARPHIWEGMFSFRKGWLVYTPVMALALAGMALLPRKEKAWGWPMMAFVAVNLWIVLSWHIWWYADSFGMRALVQSYAVLALPMGLAWERWTGPTWKGSLIPALVMLGIGWNGFQTWQIREGILRKDGMNRAFYCATVGAVEPDPGRLRWLDVPDAPTRPPLFREAVSLLSAADPVAAGVSWQADRPGWLVRGKDAFSPTIRIGITDSLAHSWSGQWLEVEAWVLAGSDLAPSMSGARLVVQVQQEGRSGLWLGMPVVPMVELGQWWPVHYEFRLPEDLAAGDGLLAMIWVPDSPDDLWLHEIRLNRLFF